MTDYVDMGQVLQEFQEIYPNLQTADLYILMKVYQSIIPSSKFVIKESIWHMYTNEIGKQFVNNFLSLSEALSRGGILPKTFILE